MAESHVKPFSFRTSYMIWQPKYNKVKGLKQEGPRGRTVHTILLLTGWEEQGWVRQTGLGKDSKLGVLVFTKPSWGLLVAPLHKTLHVKVSKRDSKKKSQFLFVPVLLSPLFFRKFFLTLLGESTCCDIRTLSSLVHWEVSFNMLNSKEIPDLVLMSRTEGKRALRSMSLSKGRTTSFHSSPLLMTGWQFFMESWPLTHPGHQEN